MNIIDQIRAEIERRRKIYMEEYKDYKSTSAFSKACECVELLKFLDTLKEQPVDLEKEVASYITQFGWGNTKHLAEKELINRTARHFYELGRQSIEQPVEVQKYRAYLINEIEKQYKQAERNYQEAYEQKNETRMFDEAERDAWERVLDWLKEEHVYDSSNEDLVPEKEQPACEGLEELVNDYLQEHNHDVLLSPYNGLMEFGKLVCQWMREKMMREAVKVRVQPSPLNGPLGISAYCCNFPSKHPFYRCKIGDKVKLVIIKED